MHRYRRRTQKRFAALGAVIASLALWFVVINVGRTGHTKVLKATSRVVAKIDRAGSRFRSDIHKLEGDEGYDTRR